MKQYVRISIAVAILTQVFHLYKLSGFDMELMLELDPDLVMTSPTGEARFDHHGKLQESGFSVVFNSEYMETTPLGRSECRVSY